MTEGKDAQFDPATMIPVTLEAFQQWTGLFGRAQQMLLEHAADAALEAAAKAPAAAASPALPDWLGDPAKLMAAQAEYWGQGLALWQAMLGGGDALPAARPTDRRFAGEPWSSNPVFDLISRSYLMLSDHLLGAVDRLEGVDERQRRQLRFATTAMVEALSPSNFALTNPEVIAKTIETKGENLVIGMGRILEDIKNGQLSQTDTSAFELGRNIAATPGKVVRETPLYQLIQYAPATPDVDAVPLVIFPAWINRYYILDLNPANSFVRWAVEQGMTVFVVSWKSADSGMAEVSLDDYVLNGIVDAIDTVRDLLGVPSVHTAGYCVAGTTLSVALAWLAANGQDDKVASATFFAAQVDFTEAGDLGLFVDEQHLALIETLAAETGYLDGRYMAATFNLLRGRDLIWNYVVNNYMLGKDYSAFDLLYWNGDTTNLPAKWHANYLRDFYRDNKLVQPGGIMVGGAPIDLGKVTTPAYVQAGREDHIAPPHSVWKATRHFAGPTRFLLAGSGHIAGVINPPAAGKYQYWSNDAAVDSYDAFVAGAQETKGSWWPDWRRWILALDDRKVKAKGARIPGKGKLPVLDDAPGTYART